HRAVEDKRDSNQDPVGAEIGAQKLCTHLEEQYTKCRQHWEHDEVSSNRPLTSPPTSPPVDDQPVKQPHGHHDDNYSAEEISNAVHYLITRSTKDTRLPLFLSFMLPRNWSSST